MSDEEWLELLAEEARKRRREDAAILAQMAATTNEEAQALLAPLDEEARARIAAAAFPESRRALTRRAKMTALAVGAALAIAAAVALVARGTGPSAPLPPYEVALFGAPSHLRGAPGVTSTPTIAVAPESPLEIVLRPDVDVRGPVVAGAFLVEGGGARRWSAPIEVSEDGAVRIAGRVDSLFGARRGEVDVIVIVARPGALPEEDHALDAPPSSDSSRRAVKLHMTIAR
jgi:hypothetical protein